MFRRSENEAKLLSLAATSVQSLASTQEEAKSLASLADRPLASWFILGRLKQELRSAGIEFGGTAIDWDKIGDFIVKITPILFELFKMFL